MTMTRIIATVCLSSLAAPVMGSDPTAEVRKPTQYIEALPATAYYLFAWPGIEVLNGGKRINPDAITVAAARNQASEWIKRVIDPAWRPPENNGMVFLRKEFNDRDVVRVQWDRNDYHIEASQTASVFALKLTPLENKETGRDTRERYEFARELCLKVFADEAFMWPSDGQGGRERRVPVPKLRDKIVSFSFDPAKMQQLSADGVVIGTDKSMKDEGISASAKNEEEAGADVTRTPQAWSYWFRNIRWWNNGHSVGFYFLKIDGPGAWVPSYVGEIDRNWFRSR